MYEHNALGYWSSLAQCLTKVRSSRACCPATALMYFEKHGSNIFRMKNLIVKYLHLMHQSFVTTAPPPTGKGGDYDFSAFSALL